MQHNIDQKEQSRQNNAVGVHRDVVIERSFQTRSGGLLHTLAAERQRELIKTVAIDWSSFSVRGSCLFRLARRRTGISSIKFASLCQSCGFNRSARCPALLTTKSSTPVPILSVFSPTSKTARTGVKKSQVFRRNHAENNSSLLASNKNGSRHSDRRDQCSTTTKFVSLSFTSFRPKSSSKLL